MSKKVYKKEEIIDAVKEILEENGVAEKSRESVASEIYDLVTVNYINELEAKKTKEISAMKSLRKINSELDGILDSDAFSKVELFDEGVKVLLIVNGELESTVFPKVMEAAEKCKDFFGKGNVMIIMDSMMQCFLEPKDPRLFGQLMSYFPKFFPKISPKSNEFEFHNFGLKEYT